MFCKMMSSLDLPALYSSRRTLGDGYSSFLAKTIIRNTSFIQLPMFSASAATTRTYEPKKLTKLM